MLARSRRRRITTVSSPGRRSKPTSLWSGSRAGIRMITHAAASDGYIDDVAGGGFLSPRHELVGDQIAPGRPSLTSRRRRRGCTRPACRGRRRSAPAHSSRGLPDLYPRSGRRRPRLPSACLSDQAAASRRSRPGAAVPNSGVLARQRCCRAVPGSEDGCRGTGKQQHGNHHSFN